jgi:SAM-dependent methyltransferase
LPPDDPEARRSRRDLRWVDFFMRNSAWVVEKLGAPEEEVAELGAGEGLLAERLALLGHRVTALDLAPEPPAKPPGVRWLQGDFFTNLPATSSPIVVGTLVLHHFDEGQLRELGRLVQNRRRLLFVEPFRSRLPLFFSWLASPLCGRATRHDMPASIRAGFVPGELRPALGLGEEWIIEETIGRFGALQFAAWHA